MATAIGIAVIICRAAGLRVNFTDSAPHGLWQVRAADAAAIKRGSLIEVCPPDSPVVRLMGAKGYLSAGNCDGSSVAPLLKPVSAVPGDTIRLRRGEPVTVNAVSLPNTQAMPAIPAWPEGDYIVQPGELWLFSSYSSGSFDSRYFGPVALTCVRGVAVPVAVNGNIAAMTTGVTQL